MLLVTIRIVRNVEFNPRADRAAECREGEALPAEVPTNMVRVCVRIGKVKRRRGGRFVNSRQR